MKGIFCSVLLCISISAVYGQDSDELLAIFDKELKREQGEFSKVATPPYFISYRVNDIQTGTVSSSFGSLVNSRSNRSRTFTTNVRVGNYDFDNTHPIETLEDFDMPNFPTRAFTSVPLPLDNQSTALSFIIWQQTQLNYRSALNTFNAIKKATKKPGSYAPDFSKETPIVSVEAPLPQFETIFKKQDWEPRLKKYTNPFLRNSSIIDAAATLQVIYERKYFISSEGTRIAQNQTYAHLFISASIRAEDGDIIPLNQSYLSFDPASLPTDEKVLKDVDVMIGKLTQLRNAPIAEPYTGPAILYSRAAGVFFHEIFGHRVEGHRLKSKSNSQTFKDKIDQLVLPKSISVVSDPTRKRFDDQDLNGFYKYDDEGVEAKKVTIVEDGQLKTFLMSRSPIENIRNSNGHGRAQDGMQPVSRQSNLIIENKKPLPMSDLRKMLIKECQRQKKPYGYLFKDVVGGFTMTDRYMPNAFNIFPTEVYRIYADGKPDELVRGVDLIGTPLAMFAEITAADNLNETFIGFCGAESGSIPVSAVSPSLFVKRIETQKKPVGQVEKTLLEKPKSE